MENYGQVHQYLAEMQMIFKVIWYIFFKQPLKVKIKMLASKQFLYPKSGYLDHTQFQETYLGFKTVWNVD